MRHRVEWQAWTRIALDFLRIFSARSLAELAVRIVGIVIGGIIGRD